MTDDLGIDRGLDAHFGQAEIVREATAGVLMVAVVLSVGSVVISYAAWRLIKLARKA